MGLGSHSCMCYRLTVLVAPDLRRRAASSEGMSHPLWIMSLKLGMWSAVPSSPNRIGGPHIT